MGKKGRSEERETLMPVGNTVKKAMETQWQSYKGREWRIGEDIPCVK